MRVRLRVLAVCMLGLVACGSGEQRADVTFVPATPPATTTAPAPTTTASTTTTSTIAATTTTEVPLPVPAPPPADSAIEPKVQIGTIEIPKINLTHAMFDGVALNTLNNGPGHWPGTAMPGEIGNVVVAGHRVSHDHPFRNLDKLVPGDQVIFTTAAGRFVYVVVSTEVVDPTALRIIEQTRAYTATLFACHPPGSTRERIVVHLQLAP